MAKGKMSRMYHIFNNTLYGIKVICSLGWFAFGVVDAGNGEWSAGLLYAFLSFLGMYLVKLEKQKDREWENIE